MTAKMRQDFLGNGYSALSQDGRTWEHPDVEEGRFHRVASMGLIGDFEKRESSPAIVKLKS